ncbi:hypothetical protein WJX77_007238 [Trebouxia sp. C0004]
MAASTPRFKAPTVEVPTEDSSPALSRLLNTFSPRTRKLSKLGIAERQFAFEAAFHCIDEAYKAKGPFLRHACHFRAERYKVLKAALNLRDDQAKLPTEGFAQGFAFPGEASATNVTLPTPEGSPEAKRLTYHEPAVEPQTATKTGGVARWWRNKFSSKKTRKSTPSYTALQSVPEDSSATPSKAAAPGPALARVTDADSTDGSPKIHVGRMVSNTQSSMQLSNIMKTNQLFEQGSNGLAQEVHPLTAQNHGGASQAPAGVSMHRRGHSTGSLHHRQLSAGSAVELGRAFDSLLSAAPTKGDEVQHWIWLLRTFSDRCCVTHLNARLLYMAKVSRHITCEESWLRLLAWELTPIMQHLHHSKLHSSCEDALHLLVDRAMRVAETALHSYRTQDKAAGDKAALLLQAVKLLSLLSKCAMPNGGDVSALFEEHMRNAANRRYRTLKSDLQPPTLESPRVDGSQAAQQQNEEVKVLAALAHQLVQDVGDDQDSYQQAFGTRSICLPAVTCRVYCVLLRPDIEAVLAGPQKVAPNEAFFRLLVAVHQLDNLAIQWCGGNIGRGQAFAGSGGGPMLLSVVEDWVKGVRSNLLQWSTRLLGQEQWQPYSSGQSLCSWSLVELYRALGSSVDAHKAVLAAHPMYANLMERALAKVVLQHVTTLEKFCQAELPNSQSSKIIQPLRALKSRQMSVQLGQGPTDGGPGASARLCAYLNDMRELRTKQGELTAAFKACVPVAWWGTDAGYKSQLGDRFKMCQVDIERSYALVLHKLVRRINGKLTQSLRQALDEQLSLDANCQFCSRTAAAYSGSEQTVLRLQPLTNMYQAQLAQMAGLLDVRVFRRVARELWNAAAGHLHEVLTATEAGRDSDINNSMENIMPRVKLIDASLKHVSDFFVTSANAALSKSDEPDKVKKLRRMLSVFTLQDQEAADSFDCSP